MRATKSHATLIVYIADHHDIVLANLHMAVSQNW